jgi:hypothetical protein
MAGARRHSRRGVDRGVDRGSAAIELVGVLSLFVVVLALAMQSYAAVYAAQAVSQAARDGAREYSRSLSLGAGQTAVQQSLPGSVQLESAEPVGPGYGMRVTARIPVIFPLPPGFSTVTSTVVMP